jgi:general secretion pathway protein D
VTTNIRIIENNVIADDGQIIVLGGLIKDDTGNNEEKVRGLGDIPFFGNLFKYRSRARKKTNLMVFLRPVIVRSKEDSSQIAADRYDFMRSAGEVAGAPKDDLVMPDYGSPVLPKLNNGQPPAGGAMVKVPARPAAAPVPARSAPGTEVPAAPATPPSTMKPLFVPPKN